MANASTAANPFRRILFCSDFSPNADFAFHFALDSAMRRPGSELHLLHVIPESDAQFWKSYMYEVDDVDAKAKRDIDQYIERHYRPYIPHDLNFTLECRVGRDWQEILDYANSAKIDLIVLGRHGKSGIGKALFGNVTEKVSRHAGCAVLVIPLAFQQRLRSEAGEFPG